MRDVLSHLFLPQESNNHRAKLLHHSSLFFLTILLFVLTFSIIHIKTSLPSVLGTATDISIQELLILTNQERQSAHLPPLGLNNQLVSAAEGKAKSMFAENYWAHFSPSGVSPWYFIKGAGYSYTYAGENLARGFLHTSDIIKAWMHSPTHRANVLSPNYQDVGFAVEDGVLLDEQTTLVVEEFGSQFADNKQPTKATLNSVTPPIPRSNNNASQEKGFVAGVHTYPLFNSLVLTKSIGFMLLIIFITTLIADAVIVEKKKVARILGSHFDHLFFFILILLCFLLVGRGLIL